LTVGHYAKKYKTMNRTVLIIFLIILSGKVLQAQNSLLYDTKGNLLVDSLYKVPTEHLKYIYELETSDAFHRIYKNFEYPLICYENGVGGLVIAKICLNRKNLRIACVIEKSEDIRLGNAVQNAIYKSAIELFQASPHECEITFYLPFIFEVKLQKFDKELRNNGFIKVEKSFLEGKVYLL
jgi:hypothetical protein